MFHVYILLCNDNSFYVGHSYEIKNRILAHNKGQSANYTKSRLSVKLVYIEKFTTKEKAINREKQIKGLSRKKKIDLIKFGHPKD